jgi:hypothetical protein
VGEDLAGFQKLLFWTPDITPHPSLALVFHVIFVKPKTASREPCVFARKINNRLYRRNVFDVFGSGVLIIEN